MTYHNIPLSLYIHIPWCIKKCPYCDFNSHNLKADIPEVEYTKKLLEDLAQDILLTKNRPIQSIFFGGGTPSLFSANAIGSILTQVSKLVTFTDDIEITLEANPGTIDVRHFADYRKAGINRLSIGIQSFEQQQLQNLGRIHDDQQAINAIQIARDAGFNNINLDLMFGLSNQTIPDALKDLQTAIKLAPEHISWYQLTLEPNTVFYKYPPPLPPDDYIADMQLQGQSLLADNNYQQYEISAYAQPNKQCRHNINYWQFGDYIGIGAGAHGKITEVKSGKILRTQKYKFPQAYLNKAHVCQSDAYLNQQDIIFEFMLNALRLYQDIEFDLFTARTGLTSNLLMPILIKARQQGFIEYSKTKLMILEHGRIYLNDLIALFLPE